MIELNSQLCKELDLTYWQLKQEQVEDQFTISHEEKELLRKILIAKAIKLEDSMLEIQEDGIVLVTLIKHQLVFNNVDKEDTNKVIHLSKISEMMVDSHQKKLTWYKLKDLDL